MNESKTCAQCGASFSCGRNADACWCQRLPLLPRAALDVASDCLCPACLKARVRDASELSPPRTDPAS